MGVIRRLVTVVELQADKAAKALKQYDTLWKQTAKSIESYAASVEADANRVVAATQRMAAAMATVPRAGRGGGGGGTPRGDGGGGGGSGGVARIKNAPTAKGPRKGGDDLDRAIAAANKAEGARALQQDRSAARMAGLAAGSEKVNEAAKALDNFASKSDKARAAVRDLEAQVAKNRREMADLKAQALATGDTNGTLTARMQGLAVATGKAVVELADARKELRAVDGGLIDAVKNVKGFSVGLGAMAVAAGNLISAGLSRAFHGIKDGIVGAAGEAIEFKKVIEADLAKLLGGTDDTAEGLARIETGIKKASVELGVMPDQVAKLAAALAPVFSGKIEADTGIAPDLVALTAEVTKIGTAWDVSAAEAGQFFADISRGLDLTSTQTKALFGSINELSNVMGIRAATIAEAVQRSAGVLKASGLSPETGAALNATLIATGASAEVAATGVRTFVARLEAGRNASPKALEEFKKLGLDAVKVGEEMSKGGKQAEAQLLRVVKALDELPEADKLPALIGLFGSESIGSIGAAAGVEALAKSFALAGSELSTFASVEKEYDRVSQTTAARLDKLKATVGVLAIEFGEALLPTINEVVDYLTSPEGQEWGRSAVEGLVGSVKSLVEGLQAAWPVVTAIGGAISSFTEAVGGSTVAIGLLSAALLALTGPFVAVPVLATAAGAAVGQFAVDSIQAGRALAEQTASNMADVAKSLGEGRGKFGVLRDILGEVAQSTDRSRAAWAAWMQQMLGATGAVERFYDAEQAGKIRSGRISEEAARKQAVDASRLAHAQRTKAAKEANDAAIFNNADSRYGGTTHDRRGAGDQARFDALSARVRAGEKLKPSEAKEYSALSKRLDEAKSTKSGKPRKLTEMERQLQQMDKGTRAILRQGGEEDASGHRKVADNVLDRAVFAKATGSGGGGGSSPGPGPNVTTHNTWNDNRISVQVDASSSAPAAENIRQAAQDLGASTARVRFTGQAKVVANRNAGGRMA